ncbi:MAG: response regulator transcription factor [Paludibacteraceae bacterium]|nr:response regulator transcription factor [Paludibacteraceae bacterium]
MLGSKVILLYFQDANLASLLSEFLAYHGYHSYTLDYAGNVVSKLQTDNYAALVMEYQELYNSKLRDISSIRLQQTDLPVIVVAPQNTPPEVAIEAYNNGADQFLRRSFSLDELLLRLKALIKFTQSQDNDRSDVIALGSLSYDYANHWISSATGRSYNLTPTENRILHLLATSGGNIVSRTLMLRTVWHNDNLSNTGALDVYITRLRHALSMDSNISIYNMRARGYRLVVTTDDAQN